MDYKQHIDQMITHLDANNSPENFSKFAGMMGHALATTFAAYIVDHGTMHKALGAFVEAMQVDACNAHKEIHGEQVDVDYHAAPEVVM